MKTGSAEQLAAWLKDKNDIMVVTHIRPDGDAYGTALSVTAMLTALGKRAFAACDDRVEPKYAFLPGSDRWYNQNNLPFAPACALSVDVSNIERMGKLAEAFQNAPARAVLDHHATNDGFGDINFIEPDSASAGEMALTLLDAFSLPMTKDLAVCLFTAISTDCGNFSFSNTSPRSYRSAARCLQGGANAEELTRRLYRLRSEAKTRLLGMALAQLEVYADGKIAAVRLYKTMFSACGATPEDAHSIVNYVNEVDGVKIGILAEEQDGAAKFSFRSAGDVNVAALAQRFGGGGHEAAAGLTVKGGDFNETFARVLAEACKVIREDDAKK